jgi:IPT/TIG domain
MENESFDPDATPVEGTRATRRSATAASPALPPRVRRFEGAGHNDGPGRVGVSKALVFTLGGVLVVLIVLAIVDLTAPSLFSGLRNTSRSPHLVHGHIAPAASQRVRHPKTRQSGSAPVLTSISPQIAAAGSTVELTGTGFFSTNNQIVARVAGNPAPTRCPTEELCYVVLPEAPKGTAESSIEIVTASGTSNSLEVRYG